MEENVTQNNVAESTPTTEAQPVQEQQSMETGGATYDGSKKLGWLAIMMLGLTTASLIYSIHYYRKKVESLKRGEFQLKQMKQDIDALKQKLNKTTGNRVRYGKLA